MAFDLTGTLSKLAGRNTVDDDTVDDTVDEGTGTMSQIARRQIMARINSLKAERSGGDNFSAFAAGLLRPTQTGSFGESLGYGLAELNKSDAASKTARDAREDLMLKYQLALADDEAKAGVTAANAAKPIISVDPLGRGVFSIDRVTGKPTFIPTAGLPPSANVPTIVKVGDREFIVENKGTSRENTTELKPAALTADEQADKIAAATEARVLARDMGLAKTMLPKAKSAADRALAGVDSILNHPGLSAVVGMPKPTQGGLGFMQIRGTPAANFKARLDQLKGGAFLEAYNILKGGGQISNTEGTKAEAAIVRASTAQTEDEFKLAMNDYADAIRTGLANLETSASGAAFDIGRAPPAAPAGAAPATVRTSSGAKLTPEQATQRLLDKGYTLKNGTLVAPSGVSG